MGSTSAAPVPITAAVHGPYEDLAIAGLSLMGKLIDGATVEQRQKMWEAWIEFWDHLAKLVGGKPPDVAK